MLPTLDHAPWLMMMVSGEKSKIPKVGDDGEDFSCVGWSMGRKKGAL